MCFEGNGIVKDAVAFEHMKKTRQFDEHVTIDLCLLFRFFVVKIVIQHETVKNTETTSKTKGNYNN
jgi:hypothetical protein